MKKKGHMRALLDRGARKSPGAEKTIGHGLPDGGMKKGPRRTLIEPSGFSICEKWEAVYTRRYEKAI